MSLIRAGVRPQTLLDLRTSRSHACVESGKLPGRRRLLNLSRLAAQSPGLAQTAATMPLAGWAAPAGRRRQRCSCFQAGMH